MTEHRLTETLTIKPTPAYATAAVGRYSLVGRFATDVGTLADVAALGRALVAFAGGLSVGEPIAWAHYRDDKLLGFIAGPSDPRLTHDPGPRSRFVPLFTRGPT